MLGSGRDNFSLAIQIEIMVENENILAFILLWSRDYSIFGNVYASFSIKGRHFLLR